MKALSLSLLLLFAVSTAAMAADPALENNGHTYPPIAIGPSAGSSDVVGVLMARQFTLDQPHAYTWRADQPAITSGWLLVVGVTPELAAQRDNFNPVLYVGRYPAEIAATDARLGHMVVIVPGDVDLTRDPVYFGSVQPPEEVTPERAAQEMQAATAAGFRAMSSEALRLAETAGGAAVHLRDAHALYAGPIADTIDAYAPESAGVASGYRAPLVTP